MIVIPEGPPFEATSGSPFESRPINLFGAPSEDDACPPRAPPLFRSLSKELPIASFRSFRRNPCRTVLRKVPPVPEASPKVVSPKALLTRLRNRPFGLSFGTCHVSRRASRKLPRKPFEAAPRDLPDLPSEHATCIQVPSENPSSRSPPSHHVSRDSPRENPEYLPEAPNAL